MGVSLTVLSRMLNTERTVLRLGCPKTKYSRIRARRTNAEPANPIGLDSRALRFLLNM